MFVCGLVYLIVWMNKSETHEFELEELEHGTYCYYETIVSNVPANNYTIITFCVNGNVKVIKGEVSIIYTDSEPKCIWKSYNYVNGDKITIYVPRKNIQYLGTTSSNRR